MKALFSLLLIALLFGCGKDVPAPTYLKIDQFTLQPNADLNMGKLTHDFSDVYLYIDDQPYGVFPLPCVIPLNLEGVHTVMLMPAVRKNGNSELKTRYPFVERHIEQINFVRLDTMQLQPETKYFSTTQVWYEDFEDAAIKFESTNLSTVNLVKSSDPSILEARNQNFYAMVSLNADNFIWDALTTDNWALNPGPQREAYIEIDYYNLNSLQTGLRSQYLGGFNDFIHVGMRPLDPDNLRWRKMYIEIKDLVGAAGFGNTYKMKLSAILDPDLTETMIAIDNVKLIYR